MVGIPKYAPAGTQTQLHNFCCCYELDSVITVITKTNKLGAKYDFSRLLEPKKMRYKNNSTWSGTTNICMLQYTILWSKTLVGLTWVSSNFTATHTFSIRLHACCLHIWNQSDQILSFFSRYGKKCSGFEVFMAKIVKIIADMQIGLKNTAH